MKNFKLDWVLINEIAIGPTPRTENDLQLLKEYNIQSVLSLCSVEEAPPPKNINNQFNCMRVILPDHRSGRLPYVNEIEEALNALKLLTKQSPVFIHCVEGVERSPLICLAWLIIKKKLNYEHALRYLMEVHPETNPLDGQIKLINNICQSSKSDFAN